MYEFTWCSGVQGRDEKPELVRFAGIEDELDVSSSDFLQGVSGLVEDDEGSQPEDKGRIERKRSQRGACEAERRAEEEGREERWRRRKGRSREVDSPLEDDDIVRHVVVMGYRMRGR